MYGNCKGNFLSQNISQRGLYILVNGKAIIKLRGINNELPIVPFQTKGFQRFLKTKNLFQKSLQYNDKMLRIILTNGSIRRQELYYGTSFLSQSSEGISVGSSILKISVVNHKGAKRILYIKYK